MTVDLGPNTERRFADAFARAAVISKKAAAKLLGLDEKTLDALSEAKIVRAVRKGSHRAYTERDLRAYLIEGPDLECPPKVKSAKARPSGPSKVVNFSERRRETKGRPQPA